MLLAPSSKSSLAKLSRLLPGRRLLLILWPFLVIAVIFVVLIAQSLAILSAGRAFVEGESLWSKAQKSSVMHLVRYVHSHDEADYRQFQQALKVPLGDRKARLELEKPNPDLAVAYQGFLEGRNHPDDIPGLITLFRRLRNVSYIDRCITLWTDADRSIDELIAVADTLHRRVLAGETDPSTVNSMLASIFEVDAQLTSQSDAFSASLGEATRVAILILSIATLVLAGTLIPIALMLSRRMLLRGDALARARLSEERFDLAISGSSDGIWDWNVLTDRFYRSSRFNELIGCAEQTREGSATALFLRLHPDDAEATLAQLKARLNDGAPCEAECRLKSDSGEYRWFLLRGRSVQDGHGRAVRMAGSLTHITDRKEMEFELKHYREFMHAMINAISQPFCVKDVQHRWVECNDAFCDAMGQSRETLLGKTDFDFLAREVAQRAWDEDDAALASEHALIFENEMVMPSGEKRWFLKSKRRVATSAGEIYTAAMSTDITALKHAQQALHESEARFRSLVEMSSDWYWEQDEELRFTSLSGHAFRKLKRVNRALGRTRWEIPDVDLESADWEAHKAACFARKAFRGFEFKRNTASGTAIWTTVSGEPVFDETGRFKGYRGTAQDITARVHAQEELRRHRDNLQLLVDERTRDLLLAKEAAEAANRAKSEFLANMSHELRTPMHAILSFARLGLDKSQHADVELGKLTRYFSRIDESGERLLSLLNDLLDLSKLEAGKMLYQMNKVDVAQMLCAAVARLESLAREKNIDVIVNAPDMPLDAWCDADRIGQVVLNLVSNAIKFSRPNSPVVIAAEPNILHYAGADFGAVRVSVSDRGVGIPEAELDSVFDKFFQSSATKTGSGGTGLGLSICREIVNDHGGRIWAESADDGVRFSFVLPSEPLFEAAGGVAEGRLIASA